MKWFGRQHQEAVSPEAFTAFLLKLTNDIVKDTSQTLKKRLNAAQRSKLPKVEEEIFFFLVFALDCWWITRPTRTQEERRIFRQAFEAHLANIVTLDTWQARLSAYGQIVAEKHEYKDMLWQFALKFTRFCGMPLDPYLLVLVPELFATAFDSVLRLESVRLKLR